MSTDFEQYGVQTPAARLRCPVCSSELIAKPIVRCPVCDTPAHAECREYLGGCARFACSEAATPRGRLAEVVRLVHAEMLLGHTVNVLWMGALGLCWPLLFVGLGPLLLWQLVQLGRALVRRRKAHPDSTQEELGAELEHLLRHHPRKLSRSAEPPEKPSFVKKFHWWFRRLFYFSLLVAIPPVLFPVGGPPPMGFLFVYPLVCGGVFALGVSSFTYSIHWIAYQRVSRLNQAAQIFHAWRDELLPGGPGREKAALVEEKKQAGKA